MRSSEAVRRLLACWRSTWLGECSTNENFQRRENQRLLCNYKAFSPSSVLVCPEEQSQNIFKKRAKAWGRRKKRGKCDRKRNAYGFFQVSLPNPCQFVTSCVCLGEQVEAVCARWRGLTPPPDLIHTPGHSVSGELDTWHSSANICWNRFLLKKKKENLLNH